MQESKFRAACCLSAFVFCSLMIAACGAQPGVTNVNLANSGSNAGNSANSALNINAAGTNTVTSSTVAEAKEPDAYQATVALKIEAIGETNKTALPTLQATTARSGNDRRMEFSMPAGGRVVFLDKGGKNYLILPEKKQYAELNRESLGFDVRRLLMPEQVVEQVKKVPGLERVGEEKYNGRDVIKYRYAAVANTQTRAGDVSTESFLLVDRATGLPLRSETVSQSAAGGNVQGYSGIRIITEISDIGTAPAAELFAEPTGMQKIESEQVRAQVNMIFNSVAMLITQAMQQAQPSAPVR